MNAPSSTRTFAAIRTTARRWWAWPLALCGLLAGLAPWAFAHDDELSPYVDSLVLVSSKAYSRDETDYTYRIRIVNPGAALGNVSAFVTSRRSTTRILDNEVRVGTLAAGSTVTPTDTFTLRQNRRAVFSPADLAWQIYGQRVNTPPVANAGADQTVRVGAVVTLDGTGSTDADGNALTYQWTLVAKPTGSKATLSSRTAPRPKFTVDRAGNYVFELVVSDGVACSIADRVQVSTANSAPIAIAGPDRTVPRGSNVTLDGTASSDPDFNPLRFAWTIAAAPTGSTATLVNATSSQPSLLLDRPGSFTLRLVVSDGLLDSAPDDVVITTENSIPLANAGPDRDGAIGVPVTLDGLGGSSDADGDPISFSWTWISRPTGSNAALDLRDASRPVLTPDKPGLYVVQLIVNDGFNDSLPDTATVTVAAPVNHPPVAAPDTATTTAGTAVTIAVLSNDSDPDAGTTLQLAGFTQPASGGTVVQLVGNLLQFTPAVGFNGTANFSYTVSDGELSATGSVSVSVASAANLGPNVNAGPDQLLVQPYRNGAVQALLAGVVTDDGKPTPAQLAISWSVLSGPGTARLQAPVAASTTVEFLAPGTYVLRLTASDGQLSASDDVQLAVTSANNTAPQLAPIASRSIERGSTLRVQLAASDNEPFDVLSYSLGAAPSGATLDARGLLEWSANATGTFTFTVSVRDPQGLTDTRSFQVTVTAADHAPQFAPLPGERTVIGAAWRRTIGVTDPDGDAVTLELIEGPAGMTLAGHALAWRPTAAQSGSAIVKLRARDPAGNATGAAFNLEVDGNAVPVARDDSYRVRVGDAPLVVAPSGVLANDADPDGASLSASRLTSPTIGTLQSFGADGGFTYQPPATDPRPAFALQARALAPGREWNDLYSVPLVGDLDRDGRPDLVFDWLNQNHTAISGRDGSVLWEADRTPLAGCFDYIGATGERVLADLDDDGRLEYVFSTACGNETQLVALDSTGHVKWRTPSFTAPLLVETCNGIGVCSGPAQLQYDPLTLATPSVARLAPGDAPVLLVHRTINANDASIQTHLDANTIGTRSIGCRAVTGDPADEHQACRVTWIVSGADGHVLQLLRAPAGLVDGVGRVLNEVPYSYNPPITADLDGDGQVEIVAGGDVWRRSGTGWQLAWQTSVEPNQVAVADLDGDGRAEVIHQVLRQQNGPAPGELYPEFSGLVIFDAAGHELRRFPLPGFWSGLITVADTDGDGAPEILVPMDGMLHAVGADGFIKWSFVAPASTATPAPPANVTRTSTLTNVQVYDLDGDGVKEVVFTSLGWVNVLDGRSGLTKAAHAAGPQLATFRTPRLTYVVDWDNDGHADILSIAQGDGTNGGTGSWVLSGAANDWLTAGRSIDQAQYRASAVDDSGRVLHDTTVAASFRNPTQRGTIRDPRAAAGTSFTYAASDGASSSEPASVYIEIAPQNSPPVVTSRPPSAIQGNAGGSYVYQVTATDPDPGDVLHYSILSAPNFVSIDANTGAVSFQRPCVCGRNLVVLAVTDGQGAQTVHSFAVDLTAAAAVSVPDVVGSPLATARSVLLGAGLAAAELQQVYAAQAAGTVIAQTPAAASTQPQGTTVLLTVSRGAAPALVPNVVGRGESLANATLAAAGFTATITRRYSTEVPAGQVIDQSPAAGSSVVPGPVALGVSLGSGLALRLDRDFSAANQPIGVQVFAIDATGAETPFTGATLSIAAAVTAGIGPLPTVGGGQISASAGTRGVFRITATDAANGRSASATFVIAQPTGPDLNLDVASFAHQAEVEAAVLGLLRQGLAAGHAGDGAGMRARIVDAVNLWRGFDRVLLRMSSPFAIEDGLPPRVADLAGFGVTRSAEDAANLAVLEGTARTLQDLIDAQRGPSTPLAEVDRLFALFADAAAPLGRMNPGEYGLVEAQPEYAVIVSHLAPDWMDTQVDDLAAYVGMPRLLAARDAGPATAAAPGAPEPAQVTSLIVEQMTTILLQTIVEKIDLVSAARKAATQQAYKGAALVRLASHLRQAVAGAGLTGHDLVEVVGGASLSVRRFYADYSFIEGFGFDQKYPQLNEVMLIGPDNAAIDAVFGLVEMAKDVSGNLQTLDLSKLWKGAQAMWSAKEAIGGADGLLDDAYVHGLQRTHFIERGCIFTTAPGCSQLLFPNGFNSVYTYDTSGQRFFSGLPVPIIVLVRNGVDGQFAVSFATVPFIPYRPGID